MRCCPIYGSTDIGPWNTMKRICHYHECTAGNIGQNQEWRKDNR